MSARGARLAAEAAPGAAAAPQLAEWGRRVLLANGARFRGRFSVFDDSRALAEFPSPERALGAALRIQADIAERNADAAEDRRVLYRIGVGAGEAAASALAARAEPGGICIDDATLAAAAGRLDFASAELGPPPEGSGPRAHAVRGTRTGRVFRYKRWTTPGRRRAALLLAGASIAAVAAALAAGRRRTAPRP